MAFCGNCGATLKEGSGFCGGCGKPAGVSAQPSVAAMAEPPAPQASIQAAGNAGQTGWTPVNAPQPMQTASPRPDSMAWSSVPNQMPPTQNAGWSSVQAQPAAAPSGAGQSWSPAPQGVAAAPAGAAVASTGLTRNMAGALAYSLGIITGILFMVLEPYKRDRFVRFHAMQSILYFVFAVAFSIAWSIVVGILMHLSGWFFFVAFPIRLIISLAMFGLWLYVMFQAYNEREFRIPILGAIASKQAGV